VSVFAIIRYVLFALLKAFQDRRAPRYQRGLIRKPLRKISVMVLHDTRQGTCAWLRAVRRSWYCSEPAEGDC
jgi:hypothetical protein